VGFGEACAICAREMAQESARLQDLRGLLLFQLQTGLEGVEINGSLEHRLPGNLNLSFAGVSAETLLMSLPDVALSTGSACSSAVAEPSHVLRSIGVSEDLAKSSVRFGLGRFNTAEEIDSVALRVIESVTHLRRLSSSTAL